MPEESTVYLNHAGTSWRKPEPVRVAVSEALASDPAAWPSEFERAHRRVADFFHVADPARLLLTPGCTSALATAVADVPWSTSDRVVTSGLEHHALHRPLRKLAEWGVRVEVLPRGDRGIDLEALAETLRRGGVRLVALSAASNVTGELLPLDDALELARQHEALTLIDAAQVAGWWDLDLPALGADMVAFAGHKGLHAPWGIGGLYLAPGLSLNSPAAACELPPSELPPSELPREGELPREQGPSGSGARRCAAAPGYCDVGSVDRLALAGLAASVRWLSAAERQGRLDVARGQTAYLWETLAELPRVRLWGPAEPSARMPTVAFTVKDRSPQDVAQSLSQHRLVVSAGLQCAPLAHETLGTAPEGVVRLSVGPATSDDDVARVANVLRRVLGQ